MANIVQIFSQFKKCLNNLNYMDNFEIKWYKSIDSTNLEAYRKKNESPEISVYASELQLKGRGQRGSRWESEECQNLTFSILFKPLSVSSIEHFVFSQIATIGVVNYLASKKIKAKIKWPNDIYVENKKICGILIENTLSSDRLTASIVGIGLNLNQTKFSANIPNPTSLILELNKSHSLANHLNLDIKKELDILLSYIIPLYEKYVSDKNADELDGIYQEYLYRLNEISEFIETTSCANPIYPIFTNNNVKDENQAIIKAKIIGVDNKTARLKLQLLSGEIKSYAFKEIRYVI